MAFEDWKILDRIDHDNLNTLFENKQIVFLDWSPISEKDEDFFVIQCMLTKEGYRGHKVLDASENCKELIGEEIPHVLLFISFDVGYAYHCKKRVNK